MITTRETSTTQRATSCRFRRCSGRRSLCHEAVRVAACTQVQSGPCLRKLRLHLLLDVQLTLNPATGDDADDENSTDTCTGSERYAHSSCCVLRVCGGACVRVRVGVGTNRAH